MSSFFKRPLYMAPLAGFTDRAFRRIVSELGSTLNFTEMVSLKALYYNDKKTKDLLRQDPKEAPLVVQVFGSEPDIIKDSLGKLENLGDFSGIDLNCGCPAPKIVNNGDGSSLMRNPELLRKMVRELVENTDLPVSVKFRSGFTEKEMNYLEIGQICEEEGASFVTLHPRTREQFYNGSADWEKIRKLRESLSIPVIGNGDCFTPKNVEELFQETDCHGISLARGALENPLLFQRKEKTPEEILPIILRHFEYKLEDYPENVAVAQMRKHLAFYTKGFRNSSKVRDEINKVDEYLEVKKRLIDYFDFLKE